MVIALLTAIVLQGAPARDGGHTAAATAVIRGRVTAAATRQPLHRVRITIDAGDPNAPAAVTDTRGVFELKVPPGAYRLTAVRAGYLTIQYGQRRPRESGQTIEVKAGEAVERIDFALYRGGVLSGRVLDEVGEPAVGARVEAVEQRYVRGRRIPVPARIVTTNDAGEYRLANLDPGSYTLRASTVDVWDAEDGSATFTHAVTWYPGVVGGDRVETLAVAIGQELPGLDLQLITGRAARITGVLLDAAGQPLADRVVNRDVITRRAGGELLSAGFGGSARTDARGAFEFLRLAPGEYSLYSSLGAERAILAVVVSDGDVKQVALTPRRETAATGSIVTDEESRPPFSPAGVSVDAVPIDGAGVLQRWGDSGPASVSSDWAFRIRSLDGSYLFRLTGLPAGWTLTAVSLAGRDITDTPLPVDSGSPEVQRLRMVISRKAPAVTGSVTDREGKPISDASVIVFAENPAQWGPGSRYVASAAVDRGGRFSVALPPGVYRAIARDAITDGQWEDPEFLQSLLKDAVRVELAARGTQTIALTLEGPR